MFTVSLAVRLSVNRKRVILSGQSAALKPRFSPVPRRPGDFLPSVSQEAPGRQRRAEGREGISPGGPASCTRAVPLGAALVSTPRTGAGCHGQVSSHKDPWPQAGTRSRSPFIHAETQSRKPEEGVTGASADIQMNEFKKSEMLGVHGFSLNRSGAHKS